MAVRLAWQTALILGLLITTLFSSACQIPYLVQGAYNQSKILLNREPLEEVLQKDSVSVEEKQKLRLIQEAREFAKTQLKLNASENYSSYVELNRPYVSYILRVAPEYELKPYTWWFPIVGTVPYKGYFSKISAFEAAEDFPEKEYDRYVRGATAYSTLGWFRDPVLSSMLQYEDHQLVNLIIHELVHATVFIPDHVDFNERLATFLGNKGVEKFYFQKEGKDSPTVQKIRDHHHDNNLFSRFLSGSIDQLKAFYEKKENRNPTAKVQFFNQLQTDYKKRILPKLKTSAYKGFSKASLNNAKLLSMGTYYKDLSDFEKVFDLFEKNFERFLKFCEALETAEDPQKSLEQKLRHIDTSS